MIRLMITLKSFMSFLGISYLDILETFHQKTCLRRLQPMATITDFTNIDRVWQVSQNIALD